MYVLLSSCARKRYRDDILRCMAAPVGAEIQFRYLKVLVGESVKRDLNALSSARALVCNVDIDVKANESGVHPLIPVRSVTILHAWSHGSTITVSLKMGDFAHAADLARFTNQVSQLSGGQTPTNAASDAESGGFWFFQISDQPDTVRVKRDLETWELITSQLGSISHFKEEPFFWTVIGLRKGSADSIDDGDRIDSWPDTIDFDEVYTMLIYVFSPKDVNWPKSIGQLILKTDLQLTSAMAPEIIVDSPYDLKRWPFKIKQPSLTFRDRSWLRIGQEGVRIDNLKTVEDRKDMSPEEINRELRQALRGAMDWEIDLPLRFNFSWFRVFWVNLVVGSLLAAPAITVIWRQTASSDGEKALTSLIALIFGIAASLVATFQIRRVA